MAGLETGKAHSPLPAQGKRNLYPDHGAVDVQNDGNFLLAERVKRKYRMLFTHHLRSRIWEHAPVMVLVFSIIGRAMSCQTEFQWQVAVILADLDIGQRLGFPRFLKSKRQIGSFLLHPCDTFDLLRATVLANAKLLT